MTALTKNQQAIMRKLGRQPIGFHFAENASERAILRPLVKRGLVRKSWNYGEWTYILTDNGIASAQHEGHGETETGI